jgi:hypothetical protein
MSNKITIYLTKSIINTIKNSIFELNCQIKAVQPSLFLEIKILALINHVITICILLDL